MPLTDVEIRNIKRDVQAEKNAGRKVAAKKVSDGGGMYLEITSSGGTYWRLKYRYAGKEKRFSIGVYPQVSLKEARKKREFAKKLLADGIDPSAAKQAAKRLNSESSQNSFQAIAEEWRLKQQVRWSEVHQGKVEWMLSKNLYPYIGSLPIGDISAPILLQALRKIEARGALETAKRVKQVAGQVFRYAVSTGRAERDPSQDLKEALTTPKKKHLAAIIEPKEAGKLLVALDSYEGTPTVKAALKLAPLVFVRPIELRHAEWSEIDFDKALWSIPAEKMKMGFDHIVPLSTQAIEVLKEIHPLTGHFQYVFPSARSPRRPMSNNAVLAAFRRLGIPKEQMSGHGFRAMARTMLDEQLGFRVDWIEHQLAHAVKDATGRAYNRTSHLEGRKTMMQKWADYLDQLRVEAASTNVITGSFGRSA